MQPEAARRAVATIFFAAEDVTLAGALGLVVLALVLIAAGADSVRVRA